MAALLLVVMVGGGVWIVREVDKAMTATATAQLERAQIPLRVQYSGRGALLSGAGVTRERLGEAERIVEAIPGTRLVRSEGVAVAIPVPRPPSSPAPTTSPTATPAPSAPAPSRPALPVKIQVRFEGGEATLGADTQGALELAARTLNADATLVARLVGHTDNGLDEQVRDRLALRRAERVADALAEYGVDRHRLSTAGAGSRQPAAPNETAAGRAVNRRVEIVFERARG